MAIKIIGLAKTIIEQVRDQEQEKFDNLPESLQYSEKGSTMEEAISDLDIALGSLDDGIGYIESVTK